MSGIEPSSRIDAAMMTTTSAAAHTPAQRTSIPNVTPKGRRDGDCARTLRRIRAERSDAAGAGEADREIESARAYESTDLRQREQVLRCSSNDAASETDSSPSCRRDRNSAHSAG